MIDELWKLFKKFNPEAQQVALEKCEEFGFDPDSGDIPLNDSYINLIWCTNTILEAIEKNKLIQLPLTIQKELLKTITDISTRHDSLIEGTDEVANLMALIEKLFTDVWQYGLNHLDDQLLGYQTKLNQLKEIEQSIITTKATIEQGLVAKQNLDEMVESATQQSIGIEAQLKTATEAATVSSAALASIEESGQQAVDAVAAIDQHKATATGDVAEIDTSKKAVTADEEAIRNLVAEFTNLTKELTANKKTQEALFEEFEKYRQKIDGLLGDANRTGMAASFTSRRKWLIAPLAGWLFVFGCSIGGLWYIGSEHIVPILKENKAVLLELLPLRLALTAPLIWLGWFSARQYGFTSRLREDYAYKEASAKSFEGFKREAKELDVEMLKKLLDQAIKNLGDNPIRIYEGKNNHPSPTHELFDNLMKDDKVLGRFKEFFSIFKP